MTDPRMEGRPRLVVVGTPGTRPRHWSAAAERTLAEFADWAEVPLDPAAPAAEREAAVDRALRDADGLLLRGWGGLGVGYLSAARLARAPRLRFLGSTCHYRQAEFVDVAGGAGARRRHLRDGPGDEPVGGRVRAGPVPGRPAGPAPGARSRRPGRLEAPPRTTAERFDRLQGRRVGLASFGEIHRHFARLLAPFETDWEAYDPYVPAERIAAAGGRRRPTTWWRSRRGARCSASPPRRRRRRAASSAGR